MYLYFITLPSYIHLIYVLGLYFSYPQYIILDFYDSSVIITSFVNRKLDYAQNTMAIETSPKFITSPICVSSIANKFKKSKTIRKTRRDHRSRSIFANQWKKIERSHLQNSSTCAKRSTSKITDLKSINCEELFTMQDNEMNDAVRNVCFERSETQSHEGKLGSRFNSPVEGGSSRSSKSPNSIEDLNKEIERLFLNNEKFGLTTFLWDKEEIAEGRRAPIADMLLCYKNKGYNRRKKRRSATVLGIRNYNESDSSNGISSPDDTSSCEDYSKTKLIETLDPRIIIPVPVGKSEIDHSSAANFGGPFSSNKLQLSEDSAFAPIKTMSRCQSTPPEDIEIDNDENKLL